MVSLGSASSGWRLGLSPWIPKKQKKGLFKSILLRQLPVGTVQLAFKAAYPQIKIPLLIQLQFCRFPTIPRFLCACKVDMYTFYEVKTEH